MEFRHPSKFISIIPARLHPKLAIDCYRDAISIYKSWLSNPKRGRYPIIKQVSIWLTPKLSYNLSLKGMKVKIRDVGELPIIGYPRTYPSTRIGR